MKKKLNLIRLFDIIRMISVVGIIISIAFIIHKAMSTDSLLLAIKHCNMWAYLLVSCVILFIILTQYKRFINGKG